MSAKTNSRAINPEISPGEAVNKLVTVAMAPAKPETKMITTIPQKTQAVGSLETQDPPAAPCPGNSTRQWMPTTGVWSNKASGLRHKNEKRESEKQGSMKFKALTYAFSGFGQALSRVKIDKLSSCLMGLCTLPLLSLMMTVPAKAQTIPRFQNDPIPSEIEGIYKRGLNYLSNSQSANGSWGDGTGTRPGVVGLCIMAFLAHGDDPNNGPYAPQIKKSLDYLIKKHQEGPNGYMGPQMYDHGFATLALAECYGMVNDKRIAPALKKCVELILEAQKNNSRGGWRYSPERKDADTSVSGCQLVALLAARNAGIAVPDEAIERGLGYMKSCRSSNGGYGYAHRSGSRVTLTAIGSLCYALAKKKDEQGYQSSTDYLERNLDKLETPWPFYLRYYMAQALFQADEEIWQKWNKNNTRLLSALQLPDGSFAGNHGNAYCTATACLSLALNYRFLPIYEK